MEIKPTALTCVVSAADPSRADYPERLARKAEASLSTVYRARDLGLLSRSYHRRELGQVYLDLSEEKRLNLHGLLKADQKRAWGEKAFMGSEFFPPALAKEYWDKYHEPVTGMTDINPFLYWLYIEKGIASNPDLFLEILHPKYPKPHLVRLHVDGKGRIAYFIWQG